MEDEAFEAFVKAGKMAGEVREKSREWIKEGAALLDIANKIENAVKGIGGLPGFPVCLSINENAAHYTPLSNDVVVLKKGDLLKIDMGVHVDGYVADTAYTICVGQEDNEIIKASKKALEDAISLCKPGVQLKDLSAAIEDAISLFGLKPISNLTGHGIERWKLHTEPQILNIKNNSTVSLKEDQVIALEPFATNGAGRIKESEPVGIFMMAGKAPVRNQDAKKLISFIETFDGLPFAERWLSSKEAVKFGLPESLFKIRMALRELRQRGIVYDYPMLKEVGNGLVSQAEHTLIIRNEPIITTL